MIVSIVGGLSIDCWWFINDRFPTWTILVLSLFDNGGQVMQQQDSNTKEGLRTVFSTNVFGHYLLLEVFLTCSFVMSINFYMCLCLSTKLKLLHTHFLFFHNRISAVFWRTLPMQLLKPNWLFLPRSTPRTRLTNMVWWCLHPLEPRRKHPFRLPTSSISEAVIRMALRSVQLTCLCCRGPRIRSCAFIRRALVWWYQLSPEPSCRCGFGRW